MQRKNFLFCGPSLQTRRETVNFPFEQLPPTKDIPGRKRSEYDDVAMVGEKRHLVYISMGTLYQLNPAFFKICFRAFRDSPHLFVMSVGKGNLEKLSEIPENFIVREYVPQPQILDRASVFISHGGMGGIGEAMASQVPMILLPKTIEQQTNARRIEELGAGVNLSFQAEDVTPERLRQAVDRLLDDKVAASYVEAARKISHSFDETGGASVAVKAIEKMMQELALADAKVVSHPSGAASLSPTTRLAWMEATEFVYCFASVLDSSNRKAVVFFFTPNGSFNAARGRDAIKEHLHSNYPAPLSQRHFFSNVLVTTKENGQLHVKGLVQVFHKEGSVCVQDFGADLAWNEENGGWLFDSLTLVPFTTISPQTEAKGESQGGGEEE